MTKKQNVWHVARRKGKYQPHFRSLFVFSICQWYSVALPQEGPTPNLMTQKWSETVFQECFVFSLWSRSSLFKMQSKDKEVSNLLRVRGLWVFVYLQLWSVWKSHLLSLRINPVTPVHMTPRYVDETTVLGKCQECKEFEAEVVSTCTKAPSFVCFIQPFDSSRKTTISWQVVLKPCQHVPVCPTCSPKINSCPQCGSQVEEKSIKHGDFLNYFYFYIKSA